MHVTAYGVSLEFRDGRILTTTIVPNKLFGKKKRLSPREIQKIHQLLKGKINVFERVISKKEFNKIKKIYDSEIQNAV